MRYVKEKQNRELQEFLIETYKWFAKVFKEEIKFDEDGNIYSVPIEPTQSVGKKP